MRYNYERTTTASRRAVRKLTTKYTHVSVALKTITIGEGALAHDIVVPMPGVTYNVGRNKMKRMCAVVGKCTAYRPWLKDMLS